MESWSFSQIAIVGATNPTIVVTNFIGFNLMAASATKWSKQIETIIYTQIIRIVMENELNKWMKFNYVFELQSAYLQCYIYVKIHNNVFENFYISYYWSKVHWKSFIKVMVIKIMNVEQHYIVSSGTNVRTVWSYYMLWMCKVITKLVFVLKLNDC